MPIVDMAQLKPYPQVKGLFQGGCVERGDGSRFRALAHAHTHKDDKFQGWICVLGKSRILLTVDGRLNQLMLHEVAHIVSGQGHTDKWREVARSIGYRVPKRYHKKKYKTQTIKWSNGEVTKRRVRVA